MKIYALYIIIIVDKCHFVFVKIHRTDSTKANPNAGCGLGVIGCVSVSLWCRMLIVGDWRQGIYRNSEFGVQFCYGNNIFVKEKRRFIKLGMMAHFCNTSYIGGHRQGDSCPRPGLGKKKGDTL
jgi:hypothetical protein